MSTTVNKTTTNYDEYAELWKKCRDAIKGHDTIQKKGDTYLPKLSGQDKAAYEKYKKQALFYNATGRTFKGYKGLVFRKEADINADPIQEFVEDCTLSGKSLNEFAELAIEEELTASRFGVLVDHPDTDNSDLSQAEAEARGDRPYLVAYKAEDIIKPKTKKIGSRTVLSQVRLKETTTEPGGDEFEDEIINQIRVLDLDENGHYRVRIFRQKDKDSDDWIEDEEQRRHPKMGGQSITEIPFYMVGGYDFREPHMIDLVNVNLSHYVAYADHRQGVAWTTRPQPWKAGGKSEDDNNELVLGGGMLWEFTENTVVDMLEYKGTGLKASENNLQSLKEDMANLGARMLMPEQNEETATEFVIKKQGENSALGTVAGLVSKCLTSAMQFAAQWLGVADPDEINIKLNTDFIPFDMKVEEMVKLWGLKQAGGITEDDYLWNLKNGERLDPTLDDEDRKAALETSPTV